MAVAMPRPPRNWSGSGQICPAMTATMTSETAGSAISNFRASATAIATGVKTNYHAVAMDPDGNALKTIADYLKESELSLTILKAPNGKIACKLSEKKLPDEMPEFKFSESSIRLDDLLIRTKTASSKGEARRLIQQGGVSINGEKISDNFADISIEKEIMLKVGKRKFAKIKNRKT